MFLTGVGCDALLQRARSEGHLPAVLDGLAAAHVIARGPKPVRILKQHAVRVDFVPPEPNTSDELLAELASRELHGKHLGLQVYGGTTPFLERLREGLASLGATVHEAAPYRWEGPADHSGVLNLIDACVAGRVDAIAIFSSSQIHNLFAIADAHGRAADLRQALNNPRLLVASVGPVASEAIESHDVHVDVQPEHPKMGHLIMALATALGNRRA
jgi:uroporphyrinogen-III synthase